MIINELVRNVVETQYTDFDSATLQSAKLRLIDIVGCTIGGANAPGCPELKSLILEWGGQPQASILIHGQKVPAGNAAWINTIMARSFDFGVITPYIGDKPIWAHIAETNVPTAISMAEWKHASGKDLLTALILGDDLSARIAAAATRAISAGWDSPGTVDKFGATAIACKLSGQNEKQIINAFGVVLNQLAGSFQPILDGAHCFKLAQGLASRDGIIASELAGKGWTGGTDPLLGRYGYFALYCQQHDPEYLTRDLGKQFYGDCMFKPYPSCRFIHSSIDCALELIRDHTINPDKIASVTIGVAPMHFNSPLDRPFELGDFPQGNATFSLRYNVANVLIRKSVKLEHFTEQMIRDPEVGALARKVDVVSALPPEKIESAEVKVLMQNEEEYSAYADVAKGNPLKKPLSQGEIEDKFRANIAFSHTISREQSVQLLDMLNNLEEIKNIDQLIKLITI